LAKKHPDKSGQVVFGSSADCQTLAYASEVPVVDSVRQNEGAIY